MGYIIFWIILFVVIIISWSDDENTGFKKITLDDINVGDSLVIKGEKFIVTNYTPEGMVELLNDGGVYYVDLGKDITFKKHIDDKYIEVTGFKGTVKSGYLNKLKV